MKFAKGGSGTHIHRKPENIEDLSNYIVEKEYS